MEYTKLGNTDIKISRICLGCMSFGKAGTMHDWTLNEQQSEEVIKHALDNGINFFDTANGYSAGTSEEYLGKALKKNIARDKVVIAWHFAKGVASPIIGATKVKYIDDAVGALGIHLTGEDVAYLEEMYVPHPIIGAINKNPEQGVMLLDEKK